MEKKTVIILSIAVAAIVVLGVLASIFLTSESGRKQVLFVNVNPPLMEDWLAVNESDAYIAWEPFASSAVVSGKGRVIMWSGEMMSHHPCCVVVVSKAFLEQTDGIEMTKRLVKAHIDATEWMLDAIAHKDGANYSLLVNVAVDFTQRSAAIVNESLMHLEYGYEMSEDFSDALEMFAQTYLDDGWITNETFATRGYSSVSDFSSKYVNRSYIDAADTVTPSTTMFPTTIKLGFLTNDIHQLAQAVALNSTVFGGQSLFQKYGLNVIKAVSAGYANGGALMDAMGLGAIDIGYAGAPPAILRHINNNVNAVIVAQANMEGSGVVVSVDSDVHSLDDLAGRVVATPSVTSIQHLLLKVALDKRDIDLVKG